MQGVESPRKNLMDERRMKIELSLRPGLSLASMKIESPVRPSELSRARGKHGRPSIAVVLRIYGKKEDTYG